MIMDPALRVGDLVTPVRVTPAFREKHGFGVIMKIVTASVSEVYNLRGKVRKVTENISVQFRCCEALWPRLTKSRKVTLL